MSWRRGKGPTVRRVAVNQRVRRWRHLPYHLRLQHPGGYSSLVRRNGYRRRCESSSSSGVDRTSRREASRWPVVGSDGVTIVASCWPCLLLRTKGAAATAPRSRRSSGCVARAGSPHHGASFLCLPSVQFLRSTRMDNSRAVGRSTEWYGAHGLTHLSQTARLL